MLVFIDESGDTGRKIDRGSSPFFVVSMVLFNDHDEALALDKKINLLKRELRLSESYEFHFSHNSEKVRKAFLDAINPYNFTYITVAINKDPKKLYGEGFNHKHAFYKYACNMVFTNSKPYLTNAIVVLDKLGSGEFRKKLATYLQRNFNNDGQKIIKKIKQQRSDANNLLQLADYITGIINRKVQNKKDWQEYHKYISSKELQVQIWPK